jgi:hypothetical protein
VQSFFGRETSGSHSHYPPTAVPSSAQLCRYLRNNGVTDVVFWPHGLDPAPLGALLATTLGKPLSQSDGIVLYASTTCRR